MEEYFAYVIQTKGTEKSMQADEPSWLRPRSYAYYTELLRVPCNQRSQSRQQKQCHYIREWANSDQLHDSHWGQGLWQIIVLNGNIPCILLDSSSEQTGPGGHLWVKSEFSSWFHSLFSSLNSLQFLILQL